MIDITDRYITKRKAKASGSIFASAKLINSIKNNEIDKNELVVTAKNAGKMIAKNTSNIVFNCNKIPLDYVDIDIEILDCEIMVKSTVATVWKAGVEIEAVCAVNGALLNLYEQLVKYEKTIEIGKIILEKKKGSISSFNDYFEKPIKTAVILVSDSIVDGKKDDKAGKKIVEFMKEFDVKIDKYEILPEKNEIVENTILNLIENEKFELILTSGGSGPGEKDIVPKITDKIIDKTLPGIGESIRSFGKDRTPYAMISCETGGVKDNSIIVNLPGSSNGAIESLQAIFPGILHIFPIINTERRKNRIRSKK